MDKVIQKQLALLKFAILPGILGGIACFIGPPHSALIKANIGVVIGFALQHKYMRPVLYGAQNETYMSRSAEKWVKGLCFNELGVGG